MTGEQQTVLAGLAKEGRCTSHFLAKELTHAQRGQFWSSKRVGRVMQQLKYRSLVEHDGVTWKLSTPQPNADEGDGK